MSKIKCSKCGEDVSNTITAEASNHDLRGVAIEVDLYCFTCEEHHFTFVSLSDLINDKSETKLIGSED